MRNEDQIEGLLGSTRTIAVVGLSDDPRRTSHRIASYMQRQGYRIIPVNPHLAGSVLGERPVASLRDIGERVDIVNVFRRPEHALGVVEEAIAIGAGAVWLQPGTASRAAVARAEAAGMPVVADECIMVVHSMLPRSR